MISYKEYDKQVQAIYNIGEEEVETILLGALVLENLDIPKEDYINEAELNESVKEVLHKLGIHAEKKSPGVFEYAAKFTGGVGKVVWAAMKGDKEKVKSLAKEFSKEALLDFLLKLDMLTLHAVTGPIHMIDAATGWHVGASVKASVKSAESIIAQIKKAIKEVKDKVVYAFAPKLQPNVITKLTDIEDML